MNEEISKVDWSIPRVNLNSKTGKENARGRNWTIVLYPESLPENWKEYLIGEQCALSPLHDKDINADGEIKKSHYHLLLSYKGNKSFEQIDELARTLHAPIPQRVNSMVGAVRYLVHMDNPEKFQYKISDIQCFGGFDVSSYLEMSVTDKRETLRQMFEFIRDNEILHFKDFVDYCLSEAPTSWFEIATERNTVAIKEYIKSQWQKLKEVK